MSGFETYLRSSLKQVNAKWAQEFDVLTRDEAVPERAGSPAPCGRRSQFRALRRDPLPMATNQGGAGPQGAQSVTACDSPHPGGPGRVVRPTPRFPRDRLEEGRGGVTGGRHVPPVVSSRRRVGIRDQGNGT